VHLTLAFTWFAFAGRSMWNQSVSATFLFLIHDDNPEAAEFFTAVMGLSQLLVSFPVGFLADRYRRDTMLKLASVVGVVAATVTFLSLHLESFSLLVVALAVWGVTWGIANHTALSALFADSIPNGERSHYFTQRSILAPPEIGERNMPFGSPEHAYLLGRQVDDERVFDCNGSRTSIILFV
jgi:MFS family permease